MDQKRNVVVVGGWGGSLRNKQEVPGLSRLENGIPGAHRSRLGPARLRRRPPELGDGAGPRHWAPFVSLYLRAGARAPALLLPLEAQALPSQNRFPALLPRGHAAPFRFTCPSGPAVLPPAQARLFPSLARPRRLEKGGKNPAWTPPTPGHSPTRICPAGPRRKPGAVTRLGAQGGRGG